MRSPNTRNWTGESITKPLTAEATPSASLGLLVMADQYPVDVATMPYASCGRVFDGVSAVARKTRYLASMVAPGAAHGRGVIARSWWPFGPIIGENTESWTATGGTTAAETVTTHDDVADFTADQALNNWAMVYTFGFGSCPIALLATTGSTIQDAPIATLDRQYELAKHAYPYVEPQMVTWAGGFTMFVSQRIADLETL